MKVLTLHRILRGYDGIRFGLVHFLNPKSINKIYEDSLFDPKNNKYIQVTAIQDKDGITLVEEDISTVQKALDEVKKW